VDPFCAQFDLAAKGDFIKDLTPQKRSLGFVMLVDEETNMMHVKFPKINALNWVVWQNHGHYAIV